MSSRRTVASWCFYDFANTIFSMNVVSLYFPLWLTPAILGFILVATLIEEVQAPYGGYPRLATLLIGGGWLVMTLLVAWFLTTRRKRIDVQHLPESP